MARFHKTLVYDLGDIDESEIHLIINSLTSYIEIYKNVPDEQERIAQLRRELIEVVGSK